MRSSGEGGGGSGEDGPGTCWFFFAKSFKGVACEDFESIVVEEGGAEIGEAAGGVEAMPGDIGKCVKIGV